MHSTQSFSSEPVLKKSKWLVAQIRKYLAENQRKTKKLRITVGEYESEPTFQGSAVLRITRRIGNSSSSGIRRSRIPRSGSHGGKAHSVSVKNRGRLKWLPEIPI